MLGLVRWTICVAFLLTAWTGLCIPAAVHGRENHPLAPPELIMSAPRAHFRDHLIRPIADAAAMQFPLRFQTVGILPLLLILTFPVMPMMEKELVRLTRRRRE